MEKLCLGIDIGSTTAKVILSRGTDIIFERYERHYSAVREKTAELLGLVSRFSENEEMCVAISGSAGLGLSQAAELPFIQEVYATGELVKTLEPDTSCVIELGGEDAKIIFFEEGGIDERMNGTCAGGTGAFIDQMATLLGVSTDKLDRLSLSHEKIYPIASRCGVFAKTDIQPLLNQGARHEDIAASIYGAVANQTVAGLAQGKKISGKVLFLGGPLYFCKGLQQIFKKTLKLSDENAVFPEYARYAVAMGTAIFAAKQDVCFTAEELIKKIKKCKPVTAGSESIPPLFDGAEDYEKFISRHKKATVPLFEGEAYSGSAFLGIDCGSTTTKLVLLSENDEILYSYYASNMGDPVEIVRGELTKIYEQFPHTTICGSAVTGYGEELIKNAFSIDFGIVETIAHYTAAKFFEPEVDFILDIGGQDIKCFKIKNGAIDSIMLNEACSSGCGSFLETFAKSLGVSIAEFAERGLFGKHPVDLGSRCTVFMNSSVKQSQKDGATPADISAGLSISVVKNAIYKVIRASSADDLGKKIVVQGGTFLNDAVLRAFERELGREVIRPTVSGLMGAYGAALYAKKSQNSTIIDPEELKSFVHTAKPAVCNGCGNRCHLTVNTFPGGKRFISGNRCEKALGVKSEQSLPNLYEFKRNYLLSLPEGKGKRGKTVGLPLSLGMYELLPLWHGIFTRLGFKVKISKMSDRHTYEMGQFSIPSDTACYPAKLMHGHISELIENGVDCIFYPCLSYNVNERTGDNHYNCPIVAYYSELLAANVDDLKKTDFFYPFLNINKPSELMRELGSYLPQHFEGITSAEIRRAVNGGYRDYKAYMQAVRDEGERALQYARENGHRIMILAGRPYHIDSEIGHGIDKLANSLGFCVVSEDSICHLAEVPKVNVLNQWTYHARLYRAAAFAAANDDVELVQLVSFGCGVDAITTDEVRQLLETRGKYYTQLKIDEITNLGAVKIRLRSLIGALDERKG